MRLLRWLAQPVPVARWWYAALLALLIVSLLDEVVHQLERVLPR